MRATPSTSSRRSYLKISYWFSNYLFTTPSCSSIKLLKSISANPSKRAEAGFLTTEQQLLGKMVMARRYFPKVMPLILAEKEHLTLRRNLQEGGDMMERWDPKMAAARTARWDHQGKVRLEAQSEEDLSLTMSKMSILFTPPKRLLLQKLRNHLLNPSQANPKIWFQ